MQQVSIIPAVVVVDSVVVVEFVISAALSLWYIGTRKLQAHFGGWKKYLHFMTQI